MKGNLAILAAVIGTSGDLMADTGWPNWRDPSERDVAETGQAFTGKPTNASGQDLIDVVAILGHPS